MPIKLIVLVGKGEKGKTSTLKHVIRKLIDLGAIKATASLNNFKGMRVNDTLAVLLERGDVSMELMYKNKRIGITTFGDDRKSIEDKIDLFISDNCDCIICASHPDGSSYTYIQELIATQNFNHHMILKIGCVGEEIDWKYNDLCDFSDCLTANEIISHL